MGLRMSRLRGFTLLEVMMATAILAVGTVSVLMVFATATGFAHRRQADQQLSQVLDEARSDARAYVNAFRPPSAVPNPAVAKGRVKQQAPQADLPGGPGGVVAAKTSTVFAGYSYELKFEPLRRGAPEAGYKTLITVRWGDGQERTETIVVLPDVIPEEEFAYALTYEEEREGTSDRKGPSDVK